MTRRDRLRQGKVDRPHSSSRDTRTRWGTARRAEQCCLSLASALAKSPEDYLQLVWLAKLLSVPGLRV